MTVTAIIPCYNAQNSVKRAVQSILDQTYGVDEIIVVNDGSTDRSLEILNELKIANDQILIIDQENQGVAAARNNAINVSKGKYLLMLDADDWFESSFLEKALSKFKEDKIFGAVMCGYVRVRDAKKLLPYIPTEITLPSCLANNGALSCLLFNKEVVQKVGSYDIAMINGYEDWDLNIRILKAGYKYGIIREILFNYTDSVGSRTQLATGNDLALKSYIYDKYQSDYQKHARYIYLELAHLHQKLKRDKELVLKTTSFKLGNKITSTIQQVVNLFASGGN